MTLTDLLAQAVGLLMLYNPPLAAVTYLPFTGHLPAAVRARISLRMFAWISILLLCAAWGGQVLLAILGISAAALTMTGGLMLLVFAAPMALGRTTNALLPERRAEADTGWRPLVAIPLIFPLSIGGGMVALVIGIAAQAGSPKTLALVSMICVALAGVIALTHFAAGSFARRMNEGGIEICKRVGGILLVAMAIQMLADSCAKLLPGLAK
jgi:multiple antibiotic resistance protein